MVEDLRASYKAAGQDQVFAFWDNLTPQQQEHLVDQLARFNPQDVADIAQKAIGAQFDEKRPARIEPLPAISTVSTIGGHPELKDWWRLGLSEIAKGRVAALVLAGGQGTRLGSSAPKGCYNIGLPSQKSLFQLQAERIAKVARLAAEQEGMDRLPVIMWYIMTSEPTRKPTELFFKEHEFFGLDPTTVKFFNQSVLPCVTLEGKIILEAADTVAVAPNGNGGIYKALNESGILQEFTQLDIRHVHMYCVDNSLVKVVDPIFIGFTAKRGLQSACKVVRKRSADESVGLFVSKFNMPSVVEYSEITKEMAEEKDPDDPSLLRYRAANIVNHCFSTRFLLEIPRLYPMMPYHAAMKKITYANPQTGAPTKPSEPNGVKLEQFIFDLFSEIPMSSFATLEVAREDEFSPVKNAPGSNVDCPETARDDLMCEGQRWIKAAGGNSGPIEIAPSVSYYGEGLDQFRNQILTQQYLH